MGKVDAFAVVPPGVEALAAEELRSIGIPRVRPTKGGVSFAATTKQLYAANLWLRTAARVVVRLGRFRATGFDELVAGVSEIEWTRYLDGGASFRVRSTSHSSRLFHTGAINQRVTDAIAGAAGAIPRRSDDHGDDADDEALLVLVRVVRDEVTISVDSSGVPLHRRGYRLDAAKAPLREHLAAAVVLASGWDRRSPFVDPLCGSGTLAIEAALIAGSIPPGQHRAFAFGAWPSFEPGTWASVMGDARRAIDAGSGVDGLLIVAADRDAGAIAATQANADRAGVVDLIDVRRAAISELDVGAPGWLVTNPPWGDRIGRRGPSGARRGPDLRDLYASIGKVARREMAGGRLAVLAADDRLAGHVGIPLEPVLHVDAGGTPVDLLAGDVPA